MHSIQFVVLFISLFTSLTSSEGEHKCDPSQREFVCLVLPECIIGKESTGKLIEFNSREDKLKDGKCNVFIKLRNINNRKWRFFIDVSQGFQVYLYMGRSSTYIPCEEKKQFPSDPPSSNIKGFKNPGLIHNSMHCDGIIEASGASQNILELLQNEPVRIVYDEKYVGVKDQVYDDAFLRKVAITRGCDPDLITVIDDDRTESIETNLNGNGEIKCKTTAADRLQIKRSNDTDFEDVEKVSCPGEVWKVEHLNGTDEYMRTTTFEMKCIKDYCKYCGKLGQESCETCEEIKYDGCIPQCSTNRWFAGNRVFNSSITCEKNEKNDKFGVWTVVNNQIPVPLTAAACYVGPYPLPTPEPRSVENSSLGFQLHAILTALLFVTARQMIYQ